MTVTPTYPGVYLYEIPSGNRPITGVATSITAFLGTAPRGPVDDPVPVFGFGDFERTFGGLSRDDGLGYAVRDFFLNGGGHALVVRIVHTPDEDPNTQDVGAVAAQIDVDGIILEATGPGAWGNALEVDVTHPAEDDPDSLDVAAAQGVPVSELFTLVVREGSGRDVPTETYLNVTAGGGPRPLDLVLAGSTLVQVDAGVPGSRPAAGTYAVAGLDVGGLALRAPDASAWAGALEAKVEHPTGTDANDAATEQDVDVADLFTLILTTDPLSETAAPVSETHAFVTVVDGPTTRRVDDVLAAESGLARVAGALPPDRPDVQTVKSSVAVPGVDGNVPGASDYLGSAEDKTGMQALLKADLFNLLCIPPPTLGQKVEDSVWAEAAGFCMQRRAFLLVDAPPDAELTTITGFVSAAALTGSNMRNAAIYFPRIRRPDPLRGNATATFAACGAIAGTYARIDGGRGVWKAPAGTDAGLAGVVGLSESLTDQENGLLNPLGINCLRTLRGIGPVIWGARTLRGPDTLADEYKYVPVRRLALFLEESLYRGTQWVVFEPNDEPLWSQIRASASARSCRGCSARAPSRGRRRVRPTSSAATRRPRRRRTSTSGSSTSSWASRRSSPPSSSSSGCSRRRRRRRPDGSNRRDNDGRVHRQRDAVRPVQELQVPGEVGRPCTSPASARSAR